MNKRQNKLIDVVVASKCYSEQNFLYQYLLKMSLAS